MRTWDSDPLPQPALQAVHTRPGLLSSQPLPARPHLCSLPALSSVALPSSCELCPHLRWVPRRALPPAATPGWHPCLHLPWPGPSSGWGLVRQPLRRGGEAGGPGSWHLPVSLAASPLVVAAPQTLERRPPWVGHGRGVRWPSDGPVSAFPSVPEPSGIPEEEPDPPASTCCCPLALSQAGS